MCVSATEGSVSAEHTWHIARFSMVYFYMFVYVYVHICVRTCVPLFLPSCMLSSFMKFCIKICACIHMPCLKSILFRCTHMQELVRTHTGAHKNIESNTRYHMMVCCSVLQCVAVCCSVLQCVADNESNTRYHTMVSLSLCTRVCVRLCKSPLLVFWVPAKELALVLCLSLYYMQSALLIL